MERNVNYQYLYYEIPFQSRVTSSILVPHMFINTILENPQPIPGPQYKRTRFAPIKKGRMLFCIKADPHTRGLPRPEKKIGKLKK